MSRYAALKAAGTCTSCKTREAEPGLVSCGRCRLRRNEYMRAYKADPEAQRKDRDRRLRAMYGISAEEYDEMLAKQGGGCAICGAEDTYHQSGRRADRLPVDHDHDTGVVRGILCSPCNRAIGFLKDDPELLERAARYLRG